MKNETSQISFLLSTREIRHNFTIHLSGGGSERAHCAQVTVQSDWAQKMYNVGFYKGCWRKRKKMDGMSFEPLVDTVPRESWHVRKKAGHQIINSYSKGITP
jgi:hypothetical protein